MGSSSSSESFLELGEPGALERLLGGQPGLTGKEQGTRNKLQEKADAHRAKIERIKASDNYESNERNQRRVAEQEQKLQKVLSRLEPLDSQAKNAGKGSKIQDLFTELSQMVEAGPGQGDVRRGLESERNLASMFERASQTGFMPTDADIRQTGGIAQNLFAGQQAQLNNLFQDQSTDATRQMALMGRSAADPILANKLAQSQAREQMVLSGQQTALGTDLAMQLPRQRLEAATQQTQILQGLAGRAQQQRFGLIGLGSALLGAERQFRLSTAVQKNKQKTSPGAFDIIGAGLGVAGSAFQLGGGSEWLSKPKK